MSEIRLHEYTAQIKTLIQEGVYDEAIAHCQHILRHYPRHVETYCLLGETCLEKGMYREAIEFFQRTLSADPESFVARVGLGIIYAEQGTLAEAIWQMERAFELAPGNAEVRREMQRLYTQRDGVEKTRLKLTRAALGRLYARNGLYERAISEFHAVLRQDPELPSTRVALIEALWHEGRRLEAVETCLDLLEALPNCLKANLILGEIWMRGGHEDAGEEKLNIARSLDPENVVAQEMMGRDSPLSYEEVWIPKLAVAAEMLDLFAPAAEELGEKAPWEVELEAPSLAGEEVLPPPAEGVWATSEGFPDWLRDMEIGQLEEAGLEEPKAEVEEELAPVAFERPEEEHLPEWLRELDVTADRGPELFAEPAPEEAAPAEEIPAWLRDLGAPEAKEEERPVWAAEVAAAEEELAPTEEIPAWLRDLAPEAEVAAEEELAPAEEIPAWLRDLDAPEVEEEGLLEAQELAPVKAEIPESLRALVEAGILDEADLDAAMAEMTAEELEAQRAEAVPAWLQDLMGEEAPEAEAAAPAAPEKEGITVEEEAPAWAAEWLALETEALAVEEGAKPVKELPAWLREIEEPEAKEEAAPQVEALPAWLREFEEPEAKAAVIEERLEAAEELPEWLRELEAPQETRAETQIAAPPVKEGQEFAPLPQAEEEAVPVQVLAEEDLPAPTLVAEAAPPTELELVAPVEQAEIEAEEILLEAPKGPEEPPLPAGMEMVAPWERVKVEEEIAGPSRVDELLAQLKGKPRDYPTRLELARLQTAGHDWKGALDQYEKLISARKLLSQVIGDLEPLRDEAADKARLLQLLGDAYMQQDRLNEALDMYRQAREALTRR